MTMPPLEPPPVFGSGHRANRYHQNQYAEPFSADPIIEMQMGQLHAGAVGWGIGLLMLVGCLIWSW